MITCPKCGKENQDHYKFCLGCGSELPRGEASPQRSFSTPTPPAGIPVAQPPGVSAPVAAPPPIEPPPAFPEPDAGGDDAEPPMVDADAPSEDEAEPTLAPAVSMVTCSGCGAQNPSNFKFCGACGAKIEAPEAAPAPAEPVPPVEPGAANLVLIRPDGSEGGAFPLSDGSTTVGRSTGQLFAADAYLSPDHATFTFSSGHMTVRDEDSLNGVYVRIAADEPMEVRTGDVVRMGQELVKVEDITPGEPDEEGTELMGSAAEDVWGRVSLLVGDKQAANAFCLTGDGIVLGRERGDVLFPEDGYVSGTHVRIQRQGEKLVVTDLNSSNGTFLRVPKEQDVNQGDYILMGQQLFRVDF